MRILISGTSGGLGASLHKRFGGEPYSRTSVLAPSGTFDLIIHCAVDAAKAVTHDTIDAYFRNNVALTRQLVAIPHRRFVFISSIDVYPRSPLLCDEEAAINAHDISGVYGITKFYAEAIVRRGGTAPLILRTGALLGPSMRENSLTRMLKAKGASIGLSGRSSFNYVLHQDVGDLIEAANERGVIGILNCCSARSTTLAEIAEAFRCETIFGSFIYTTPAIDNRRAAALAPGLARGSLETVRAFHDTEGFPR